jgi:hypothetical protein
MSRAATYGLETFAFPSRRVRRLAHRPAAALLRRGLMPPVGPRLTIEHGEDHRPGVVAAAASLGVPSDAEFFVRLWGHDALARVVFFLFRPDGAEPEWVLKLARVPGFAAQIEGDQLGLAVAAASAEAAEHAPAFLGRLDYRGHAATVESALLGRPLEGLISERGLTGEIRAMIESIAEWIVRWHLETRTTSIALAAEQRRLAPRAAGLGLDTRRLSALAEVPAVAVHNDLGAWNVLTTATSFNVVDWEFARPAGFPLWDLWYFFTDAIARAERIPYRDRGLLVARLFAGEHELSSFVLRLTRGVVDRLAIPPPALGALALLCWVYWDECHERRTETVRALGLDPAPYEASPLLRAWLDDPRLGLGWSAWQEAG